MGIICAKVVLYPIVSKYINVMSISGMDYYLIG